MRCAAKNRRGEQCGKGAVPGKTVCRLHGGATPCGGGSPHWKHGRYSKALPAHLLQRYEEGRHDGELLALRDEVALVDTRIDELLKKVDTGESGDRWALLRQAARELERANRQGDMNALDAALDRMTGVIQQGLENAEVWEEIIRLLEHRRRLAESEHRRLISLRQILTAEEAVTLLAMVADTVRRHITDRDALTAISDDLALLARRDIEGQRPLGTE